MIKVAFKTLGCKVNTYETNHMRDTLPHNFIEVNFNDIADIYIINTCSVTSLADKKSRQMINRSKKLNPNAIVVSAGCFSDNINIDKNNKKLSNADLYVLNKNKNKIWDIILKKLKNNKKFYDNTINSNYIKPKLLTQDSRHVRAFLKIEDGCNNFCSYCIIPYLRGRVKIRKENLVLNDAKNMVKSGVKEIVLTGINLTACGEKYILNIIKKLAKIDGLLRIRLGSIELSLISNNFLKVLSSDKYIKNKFCPEFHLSLQSGSDHVLKLMNRHYNTNDYKIKVDMIRSYFKESSITTDIIIGFSGETNEDFIDTFNFIKEIRFLSPHIFPYSKRIGTKAYDFIDTIDDKTKNERVKIITDLSRNITKDILNEDIKNNKRYDILVEEVKRCKDAYILIGHTKSYKKVYTPIYDINMDYDNMCKKYVGKEILVDIF